MREAQVAHDLLALELRAIPDAHDVEIGVDAEAIGVEDLLHFLRECDVAAAPLADDLDEDPLADEIVRAIPPAEQIERMAPALDRMIGALMNVEVGPLIDAVDPYRRAPDYGRPGRTLGELGRRDDPYFEERLRTSIYGTTEGMSRMVDGLAASAPALARSIRELERAMDIAFGAYRQPYRDEPEDFPED